MENELEFFGTNQNEAMKNMANKIIANFNSLGYSLPNYEQLSKDRRTYYGLSEKPLVALLDKLSCLIFDRGDPLSVPVFLKRVANGKTRDIGQPNGEKNSTASLEETFLGHGHFRCYGTVYTLCKDELTAIRLYLKSNDMDYATTEFKYKNLTITARLVKSGVQFPNSKNDGLHNKYDVTVTNSDTDNSTSFDYYDSTHNYNNAITEVKGEDLLQAFECFISDAIAGDESFEDFCDNMGYDQDSRSAEKIWKECIKSRYKAKNVIDQDLYDFANELQNRLN